MGDEGEESRYIRDLRKQIIKLRKENAQLKKKNSRIENDFVDYDILIEELERDRFEKKNKSKVDKHSIECPGCGGRDVVEFEVMERMYYKCSECGSKGRAKLQG
jgi:DNA-directed RNA polymerase subunit M/transcription elongation factor TFIIS